MVKSQSRPREMTMRMNYREIADDLASRIATGEYGAPSTQLPTYKRLAELYSVSVSTILRALSLLHERRVIYGEPGRGVYVAEREST